MATAGSQKRIMMFLGIGIVAVSLIAIAAVMMIVASQQGLLGGSRLTPDAMVYIDVPGRVALNKTLQINGPAPVPVAAGTYTLTFFDIAAPPLEVTVAPGAFVYVPNPTPHYATPSASLGVVHVAAFPPDTQLVIPDCTPVSSTRAVRCQSSHTLTAELSPGSYTLRYTNPNFPEYAETITVASGSVANLTHSFITTVAEFDTWRAAHGALLESRGYRSRDYGVDDVFFIPFEAAGIVAGELFD